MNKAIFLDRDGTVNVEKNYLYKIEDFEFLPGVVEGLKLLQNAGYLLIIITNQSGIARGYYSEEDFLRLNSWMLRELKQKGITITHVYYCPHHPDAIIERYRKDCDCRKPQLGLFMEAINDFDIDISKSFAVGDRLRDLSICSVSNCKGIIIGNRDDSMNKDPSLTTFRNITFVDCFINAVRLIVDNK